MTSHPSSILLEADAEAPARARRHARRWCCEENRPETDVELTISELVSLVTVASPGGTGVDVDLTPRPHHVLVTVVGRAETPAEPGSRTRSILSGICHQWGIERSPGRIRVWAMVPAEPSPRDH